MRFPRYSTLVFLTPKLAVQPRHCRVSSFRVSILAAFVLMPSAIKQDMGPDKEFTKRHGALTDTKARNAKPDAKTYKLQMVTACIWRSETAV